MGLACDFRQAARSGGVYTAPPSWLSIACATTGRTAQQSASSLVTSLGAHVPRAMSRDGSTFGLLVERATTNGLLNSLTMAGAGWGGATMSRTTGCADPAGGTDAIQFTSTGNQYTVYDISGNVGRTLSSWTRRNSGDSPSARLRASSAVGAPYANVTSATWAHLSVTMAADGPANSNFETRDIPPGAGVLGGTRVFCAYGMQWETGLYPTSMIASGASPATRAADVLSAPGSLLTTRGAFRGRLVVAPCYSSTEQGADHDFFYCAVGSRLYLQQSSRKIRLTVGGTTIESAALTWARDEAITIDYCSTPALGMRLAINGGAPVTAAFPGAIATPASVYLLGDNTGAQECARAVALNVFSPFYSEGM